MRREPSYLLSTEDRESGLVIPYGAACWSCPINYWGKNNGKETTWKTSSGNAGESKEWQPLRSSQEARLRSRTIRKDLPVGRTHTHTHGYESHPRIIPIVLWSTFGFPCQCLKETKQLRRLVEVGARDVKGLPSLAQPAPRQSYAPMAGKPTPSSHEPPTPSRRGFRAERQAQREGANGWEKIKPQCAKPGDTHPCWTWRNIQRPNKTQVPNVQRQRPINATNAVTPQTSNPNAP